MGDEGQAVGSFKLGEESALVVAELVAAGFYFDTDEDAVVVAEADDGGDSPPPLRIYPPAGFGSVVDAGGVLAPDGVAVVGKEGQDGTGDVGGVELAEVEGQLVVLAVSTRQELV